MVTQHANGDGHDRARFVAMFASIQREISQHLIGLERVVKLSLAAFAAGGHVLLESPPGLGKTTLCKSLGQALGLTFKRVQFTPDLMPFDIIGSEKPSGEVDGMRLRFVPGPIFTTILLADEVNRAPPKTQAALLEAMAERQVTIPGSGQRERLSPLFFVIATQNPVEMEGTYELPEAQLDRFMMKLTIHVPPQDVLVEMLSRHATSLRAAEVRPISREVIDAPAGDTTALERELARMRQAALGHMGSFPFAERVARIVRLTNLRLLSEVEPRKDNSFPDIDLDLQRRIWHQIGEGASPRAALDLMRACQALAALEDRATSDWQHVRQLAFPVLGHRLRFTFEGAGLRSGSACQALLEAICDAVAGS